MTIVLIKISEYFFGLTIDDIERIVEKNQKITKVPFVPNFFKGIMNFQGRVITVVDLADLLNLDDNNSKSFIIISKKMNNIGYLVKDIIGFIDLNDDLIEKQNFCEIEGCNTKFNCRVINGINNLPVTILPINEIEAYLKKPENWRDLYEI